MPGTAKWWRSEGQQYARLVRARSAAGVLVTIMVDGDEAGRTDQPIPRAGIFKSRAHNCANSLLYQCINVIRAIFTCERCQSHGI